MKKTLTTNQNLVLSVIECFIKKRGVSPTLSELQEAVADEGLKLKSINSLVQYLDALEKKGYVEKFSKKRGIRILEEKIGQFVAIPLLGQANCGEALSFCEEHIEDYINISEKIIKGNYKDYFFIKAVGDSMDNEKINDGDLVLIKRMQRTPSEGENIVAAINGLATIKKFKKMDGLFALMPNSSNSKHKPIILHQEDQNYICGKVEQVFNF